MRERGKDRERIRGKMILSDRKCDRERECVNVRECKRKSVYFCDRIYLRQRWKRKKTRKNASKWEKVCVGERKCGVWESSIYIQYVPQTIFVV